MVQRKFSVFTHAQWGLTSHDEAHWRLGFCLRGRYAWRVIIPIQENGQTVAFQARTIVAGVEPKYLTSRCGVMGEPGAECGRQAAGLLFNLDVLIPERPVILVEGAGDVMAWGRHRGVRGGDSRAVETSGGTTAASGEVMTAPAVALLGVALTPEKIAMLHQKTAGGRIIVALDAELPAQRRAVAHVDDLTAWGIPADLGVWEGGKDAGSGARLVVGSGFRSLRDRIAGRLGV